MTEIATSVRVSGKVQGVWFRGWTQETALARDLRGWVRNEDDGSVTALLIGAEDAVNGMLQALQNGPASAQVRQVEVSDAEARPTPTSFEVRY